MTSNNVPVRAYIRIRPGSGTIGYTENSVSIYRDTGEQTEYVFDRVFGPCSTQEEIFAEVKDAVARFVEGHNLTVFCYGNTGAGKTYTMVGTEDSPGLMCNIVREILRHGEFLVSYMEIYNEKIYDLLEPKELVLREFNRTVAVPSVHSRRIRGMREFDEALAQGTRNRTTGETRLNKSSSRSHAILRISMGECKLHLIDLAGSENNRKTGNEGIRLEESANINRSLFVLGKVVNSIIRAESRIPYRDSKLTRLLQDSLGGRGLCYIIANVLDDPEFLRDTQNTLAFASKSRRIVNAGGCERMHEKAKRAGSTRPAAKEPRPASSRPALGSRTNIRFCRTRSKWEAQKNGAEKENIPGDEEVLAASRRAPRMEKSDKKARRRDSPFLLRSVFLETPDVLLTPSTKEKSYKAFLRRAQELETAQKYKQALEDYRTIQKFCDNDFVRSKIEGIGRRLKDARAKPRLSAKEALDILNSGKLLEVKKLSRIGDKRAQAIIDFVSGGNLFGSLSDLRLLFSEKVVEAILGAYA
jgi:kinesin family member 22